MEHINYNKNDASIIWLFLVLFIVVPLLFVIFNAPINWEAIRNSGLAHTIRLGAGGSSSDVSQWTGGPNTMRGSHPSTICSTLQQWDIGSHKPVFYMESSDFLRLALAFVCHANHGLPFFMKHRDDLTTEEEANTAICNYKDTLLAHGDRSDAK